MPYGVNIKYKNVGMKVHELAGCDGEEEWQLDAWKAGASQIPMGGGAAVCVKGVGGGSRRFENFRRGPRRGKMVRGILWRREHKAAVVARKVGVRPLLEARERSRSRES